MYDYIDNWIPINVLKTVVLFKVIAHHIAMPRADPTVLVATIKV